VFSLYPFGRGKKRIIRKEGVHISPQGKKGPSLSAGRRGGWEKAASSDCFKAKGKKNRLYNLRRGGKGTV